jgi:hypothetical protein
MNDAFSRKNVKNRCTNSALRKNSTTTAAATATTAATFAST